MYMLLQHHATFLDATYWPRLNKMLDDVGPYLDFTRCLFSGFQPGGRERTIFINWTYALGTSRCDHEVCRECERDWNGCCRTEWRGMFSYCGNSWLDKQDMTPALSTEASKELREATVILWSHFACFDYTSNYFDNGNCYAWENDNAFRNTRGTTNYSWFLFYIANFFAWIALSRTGRTCYGS